MVDDTSLMSSNKPPSTHAVMMVVAFYFVSSITMVLANKAVMTHVEVPLTLLWLQVVFAVGLIFLCSLIGLLRVPRVTKKRVWDLAPMIAINTFGLSFNSLCLQYVDAGFFQVARSLVLPLTVIFSIMSFRYAPSTGVITCCVLITLGFLMGVSGEINLSFRGVFFGMMSSGTTAYHAIVIKKVMSSKTYTSMDLVYYNNVLTGIFLIPLIFVNREWSELSTIIFEEVNERRHVLLVGTCITGLFGFLINIAGFLQIKATSPVTHMVSSGARGVAQTILATMLFDEDVSIRRLIGIGCIVSGSVFYTWFKSKENLKKLSPSYSNTV